MCTYNDNCSLTDENIKDELLNNLKKRFHQNIIYVSRIYLWIVHV